MVLPKRKPNRLKNYDYSQNGAYFITICTNSRKNMFSHVVGAIHESPEVHLTEYGKIVESIIKILPGRFSISVDNYVVMPNHVHLLITINNFSERAIRESPLQSRSLISKIIGYLKMNASKGIHNSGYYGDVWQRSFYDHIIRDEYDYQTKWQYIDDNPVKWREDSFYVEDCLRCETVEKIEF